MNYLNDLDLEDEFSLYQFGDESYTVCVYVEAISGHAKAKYSLFDWWPTKEENQTGQAVQSRAPSQLKQHFCS